jgi:hypothetical protein
MTFTDEPAVLAWMAAAKDAAEVVPESCNDCGEPATTQHRTGTSNGRAFYAWLCEACDRECNQEWEWKHRG